MNMKCWVVPPYACHQVTSWTATREYALSRPDGQNLLGPKWWAGHLPWCDAPEIFTLKPWHNVKGRGSVKYFDNVKKMFEMHIAINLVFLARMI